MIIHQDDDIYEMVEVFFLYTSYIVEMRHVLLLVCCKQGRDEPFF